LGEAVVIVMLLIVNKTQQSSRVWTESRIGPNRFIKRCKVITLIIYWYDIYKRGNTKGWERLYNSHLVHVSNFHWEWNKTC